MKEKKTVRGFTLVELLVVMAIMSVLIGISVAGLGFAMRRSRNIQRQSAAANLDRALESYYSDNQEYPDSTTYDDIGVDLIEEPSGADTGLLYEYLEGSWDISPKTYVYYNSDGIRYSVCVSQEQSDGDVDCYCTGPAVGYEGTWPALQEEEVCGVNMGTCGYAETSGGDLSTDCSSLPAEPGGIGIEDGA